MFARRCWLPFATVRRCSQHDRGEGRMAKVVTFGGFKRRATSFRVAGVALRDISTVGNVLPATMAHIFSTSENFKNGPRFFGCIVPGICSNVLLAKTSKILPSGKLT